MFKTFIAVFWSVVAGAVIYIWNASAEWTTIKMSVASAHKKIEVNEKSIQELRIEQMHQTKLLYRLLGESDPRSREK